MKALSIILLAAVLMAGAGVGVEGKALDLATGEPSTDCTFTIKGNFNGTVVDVQVTVSDVTFVQCTLLRLGVKKALK